MAPYRAGTEIGDLQPRNIGGLGHEVRAEIEDRIVVVCTGAADVASGLSGWQSQ
ncbi:MAG: hypothetical protein M1274_07250 [Actinobacteria bacterium]|nr:hypothetical protein [Actinomycetota bacterium]